MSGIPNVSPCYDKFQSLNVWKKNVCSCRTERVTFVANENMVKKLETEATYECIY